MLTDVPLRAGRIVRNMYLKSICQAKTSYRSVWVGGDSCDSEARSALTLGLFHPALEQGILLMIVISC